jgi:hypothetical protein
MSTMPSTSRGIPDGVIMGVAIIGILLIVLYSMRKEGYSACRPTGNDNLDLPLKDLTVLNPYIYPYSATWRLSAGNGKFVKLAPGKDRSSSYMMYAPTDLASLLEKEPNMDDTNMILPGYPLTLNNEGFQQGCGGAALGSNNDKEPGAADESFILMPNSPVYQLSDDFNGQCNKMCGMKYDAATGTCNNINTPVSTKEQRDNWDRLLVRGASIPQGRISVYAEPDHATEMI